MWKIKASRTFGFAVDHLLELVLAMLAVLLLCLAGG